MRLCSTFYHVLSNCVLRYVRSAYEPNAQRFVFQCALVGVMSYTTAFMESLTICGFPYYKFADRDMAYTLGSAFYGIYFLVSFPMFLRQGACFPSFHSFWLFIHSLDFQA